MTRYNFFADPIAADPRYIIKLALEGGFNGVDFNGLLFWEAELGSDAVASVGLLFGTR